jgi:hypothetical protein
MRPRILVCVVSLALASCASPSRPRTGGGLQTASPGLSAGVPSGPATAKPAKASAVTVEVKSKAANVEVAATPEAWQRGLMRRRSLDPDAGMLFVFPRSGTSGFWMKDTLIPLSIAWMLSEPALSPDTKASQRTYRIVATADMEPCPQLPCKTYEPGTAYDAALEVNKGWLAGAGIGDVAIVRGRLPAFPTPAPTKSPGPNDTPTPTLRPPTLSPEQQQAVLAWAEAEADNLLRGYNDREYAVFSRDLSDPARKKYTRSYFDGEFKVQVYDQFGKYLSREFAYIDPRIPGVMVVTWRGHFQRIDPMTFRLAYEEDSHKIAGMEFRAPKAS